jgi:polar amino acid transport system substrate-binding protein
MVFLFRSIIVIVLIAAFQPTAFSSERVIKLATLNWAPYVEENLENCGFTSEIVSQIFKKAGYQVKIYFMPWARVLAEVKTGEYDAMYPAYYSEERSRIYAFSNQIAEGPLVLCKRSDDTIEYKNLIDLKPYKIGVVRGYVNTPEFDAAVYLNKKIVNNDKQNLLKLLTGRIDIAVIDKYTAKQIIKIDIPHAAEKLDFLDPPLENKLLYVGFSKKRKDYQNLLKSFNQALNEMIKKGLIDNIVKKHGF